MNDAKKKWVDDLLGKMSLEQKVGQLMVFGFCGPVVTPDVVEMIKKYHIGGLRISQGFRIITLYNDVKPGEQPDEMTLKSLVAPSGYNRDFACRQCTVSSAGEYAEVLNKLRDIAMDREMSIPLHFTIDQEGSASDDLLGGQRLYPHPMGLAAAGDPELAYRVALSIGRQAKAVGANMIHSPTVDVNTNPRNPEIGTRAYSDKTEDVIKYSLQTLKGFQEAGLIATAKHFPGRGESEADAHWGLPTVNLDLEELMRVHVEPYKALINAGLPAIMIAHCCYPSLNVHDIPAGMSKDMINNLLRGELGFKGVITTDNMMMGGILKQYEMSEAIIQMIIAGCDLILCRDESPIRIKIIEAVKEAVRTGRISEARLDEAVGRILNMRWDMGIVENGGKVDIEEAAESVNNPFVVKTAVEAAEKSTLLLRDEAGLLPLSPEKKVLLIEQVFPTHDRCNNMYCHPGLLWEEMCAVSDNVYSVEIPNVPSHADRKRVLSRIQEADVIVATNYYYHKTAAAITDLIREVMKCGKPVIVISSTPYEFASPKDFPTVITSFNPGGRENLRAAAQIIYGKLKPTAKLPVGDSKRPV